MNKITRPLPEAVPAVSFPSVVSDVAVERMRRAIAGMYPGCRGGQSCPHPSTETCECMQAANVAMRGLLGDIDAPVVEHHAG